MTTNATSAVVPEVQLTVRREISATAEELFDAFLDAESLAEFMRPGRDKRSRVTNDPRVGGAFEIMMFSPSGEEIRHWGSYRLLDRPRKLSFTWNSKFAGDHDSLVTVSFLDVPGKKPRTEVVLTHAMLPEKEVKGHTGGWTAIVELLDRMLGQKGTA
jgi:uncharacterized protein YndB with AHSA1/START domain